MVYTLKLKITYEEHTERSYYMITPTSGGYTDNRVYYPLFVGTLEELAEFTAKCCNVSYHIYIKNRERRIKVSKACCFKCLF